MFPTSSLFLRLDRARSVLVVVVLQIVDLSLEDVRLCALGKSKAIAPARFDGDLKI